MKHLVNDMSLTEKEKIISTYFDDDMNIKQLPSKAKRIAVLLEYISKHYFTWDRVYTEKEVNDILKKIHSDYVTLRRNLIEYRFMVRNKDCSEYRVFE